MNICFDFKYDAIVYNKILLLNGILNGKGEIAYYTIDFTTYNNPFFDLVKLFNKKNVNEQNIVNFVEKYGFLKSSDEIEDYQSFINEAIEILNLWKKNEQVQNADITGMQQWINIDKFCLDKSLTVANILENNHFSTEVFFREPVKEVERSIATFQYIGLKYIAREISSKIEGLQIYNEKITTISKKEIEIQEIKLKQPTLQPPNLITALYLYFYLLLQEGTRICPVCFSINARRPNAKTCSRTCYETLKKRNLNKRKEVEQFGID